MPLEPLWLLVREWFDLMDAEYDNCVFHIFGDREMGTALISWPDGDSRSIAWLAQWANGGDDTVLYDVSIHLDRISPEYSIVA